MPQLVLTTSSRYNRDIKIIRELGGYKLLVNGSRQSGPYIRKLWERALHTFRLYAYPEMNTILVLGMGGGTVIDLLAKRFPHASITSVDIDPTIILIAKQYFGIGKHLNVRLMHADARLFVKLCIKKAQVFDIIVIDLFIGRDIPEFVGTSEFYQSVKQTLKPKGTVILNYLREFEYQKKSDMLFLMLKRLFPTVHDFASANNRFFFLQR
ncbi:fused MFS/spermidine synthase [Candidatus Gottesmanbacteria bacterium]|nr:fused MFS/spermidine synthase [Candidatus Gottesmanbacteria bacterium]